MESNHGAEIEELSRETSAQISLERDKLGVVEEEFERLVRK